MRFDVEEVDENEFEVVKSEDGQFATCEEAKKHARSLFDERRCNLEDHIEELTDDISGLEDALIELETNRSDLEALEEKDVRHCDEV